MKIGLIDADLLDKGTRHPNLALMKLSGYWKSKGAEVTLLHRDRENMTFDEMIDGGYDHIYIAKVFTFSKEPKIINTFPTDIIQKGGTGYYPDGYTDSINKVGDILPIEIEHHKPDYTLYVEYANEQIAKGHKRAHYSDYLDYSIGFTTRGCFRKCSYCVNRRYDKASKWSPVMEFFDPSKKAIMLWDDNFFACKDWKSILQELIDTKKPFQFRQGLDIRLLDDEKAEALSKVKYYGDFIFAFDNIAIRDLIVKKLELWRKYSKPSKTIKLYCLCGFYGQGIEDVISLLERVKILLSFDCIPYITRHENYKTSKYRSFYASLATWANQVQIIKKMSFREFCNVYQDKYHKGTGECVYMRDMKAFEKEHPDIAAMYFDVKFNSCGTLQVDEEVMLSIEEEKFEI